MKKYENSINAVIRDFENSDIGHKKNKCCLIVIPQIQLSPYIASIIHSYYRNEFDLFVVIHPKGSPLSEKLFSVSSLFLSINIRDFVNHEQEGVEYLFNRFAENCLIIDTILAHPFASGVNGIIGDKAILSKKITIDFYADGSRNNVFIEDRKEETLIDKYCSINEKAKLYCFGFLPHDLMDKNYNLNAVLVDYRFLDFSYCTVQNINPKYIGNKFIDEPGSVNGLVISRYWGRNPYEFLESVDGLDLYSKAISLAFSDINVNNIIFRADNRIAIGGNYKSANLIDFKSLFSNSESSAELLVENFLYNNLEFLKKLSRIYVFDSSFPLIFQSPILKSLLNHDIEITIGAPFDLLKNKMIERGIKTMKKRIIDLIYNIIKLNLFSISTTAGEIYLADINEIENMLDKSDGYVHLRLL